MSWTHTDVTMMDSSLGIAGQIARFFRLPVKASLRVNDIVVRGLFSTYYAPLLLVFATAVLNAVQHIAFAAVFPMLSRNDISSATLSDLDGKVLFQRYLFLQPCPPWMIDAITFGVRLSTLMLPYAVVISALLLFSHKCVKCIGEAMVDAASVYEGVDYALTLQMLLFTLESPARLAILVTVSVATFLLIGVALFTDFILEWAQRDPAVLWVSWSVIGSQFLLFAFHWTIAAIAAARYGGDTISKIRLSAQHVIDDPNVLEPTDTLLFRGAPPSTPAPESLPRKVTNDPTRHDEQDTTLQQWCTVLRTATEWSWRRRISHIRHNAAQMLVAAVIIIAMRRGPVAALEVVTESLLYLNVPHVVGFTVVATAVSATRAVQSVKWLHRHPAYSPAVARTVLPFIAVAVSVATLFSPSAQLGMAALLLSATAIAAGRAIVVCREYHCSPSGRIRWTYELLSNSGSGGESGSDGLSTSGMAPPISEGTGSDASPDLKALSRGIRSTKRRGSIDESASSDSDVDDQPHPGTMAVPLPLAAVLDDAYERDCVRVSAVSLELTTDLRRMLVFRHDGSVWRLHRRVRNRRVEGGGPGALLSVFFVLRRVVIESSYAFGGRRFRATRSALKLLSLLAIAIVGGAVAACVVQETVEPLRPLPISLSFSGLRPLTPAERTSVARRLRTPEEAATDEKPHLRKLLDAAQVRTMTFDHFLVRIHMSAIEFPDDPTTPESASGSASAVRTQFMEAATRASVPDSFAAGGFSRPGNELGPVCHYDHNGLGVDAFELSFLATAPYLSNRSDVLRYMDFVNSAFGADWTLAFPRAPRPPGSTPVPDENPLDSLGPSRPARQPWRGFVDLRSAVRRATVVAVRGTDFTSMMDLLQNISIYAETFLFQVLQLVVPGAASLPSSLIADLVRLSAAVEQNTLPAIGAAPPVRLTTNDAGELGPLPLSAAAAVLRPWPRHYYDVVAEYAARPEVGASAPSGRLVFTGHSLGGAIGHVAAARLPAAVGATSIGFMSPGVLLPRLKLNITRAAVNRVATTIVASGDVVPSIGGQGGRLLHVLCEGAGSSGAVERCHALELTMARLWNACESVRRRTPLLINVWAD